MPEREKAPFYTVSRSDRNALAAQTIPLQAVAPGLHHLDDLVHIVPAGIQIRRLHHHPDLRLGAGLTQQNPASLPSFSDTFATSA